MSGVFPITVDDVCIVCVECYMQPKPLGLPGKRLPQTCLYAYTYEQYRKNNLSYNEIVHELVNLLDAKVERTSTIGHMYGQMPCKNRDAIAHVVITATILARDFVTDSSMTTQERGPKHLEICIDHDQVNEMSPSPHFAHSSMTTQGRRIAELEKKKADIEAEIDRLKNEVFR